MQPFLLRIFTSLMGKETNSMFNLNPIKIVGLYVFLHVFYTIIHLCITPDSGESSIEYAVISIEYLFWGILFVPVIFSFIYLKWTKKYWYITSILLLIGFYPIISFVLNRYVFHQINTWLWTPFGQID